METTSGSRRLVREDILELMEVAIDLREARSRLLVVRKNELGKT